MIVWNHQGSIANIRNITTPGLLVCHVDNFINPKRTAIHIVATDGEHETFTIALLRILKYFWIKVLCASRIVGGIELVDALYNGVPAPAFQGPIRTARRTALSKLLGSHMPRIFREGVELPVPVRGVPFLLTCHFRARPTPQVRWFHAGLEMPSVPTPGANFVS